MERVHHLSSGVADRHVRRQQRAATEQLAPQRRPIEWRQAELRGHVVERSPMHVGVVANVHEKAVKAVRADHCQKRVEERGAGFLGAGHEQTFTHQLQIAIERGDVGVGPCRALWPARVARRDHAPCRVESCGDEAQLEAHRLVRVPPPVRLPHVRQVLAVHRQRAAKRLGGCADVRGERQPLHQVVHRALVAAKNAVARAARGGERLVGGHIRVAIAVSAHPVAEPQRNG